MSSQERQIGNYVSRQLLLAYTTAVKSLSACNFGASDHRNIKLHRTAKYSL